VSNFLESIPEWNEYYQNDLIKINNIEKKPLASDPRNQERNSKDDDFFVFNFISKLKDAKDTNEEGDEDDDKKEETDIKDLDDQKDDKDLKGD
jgi:hypothetical protein